MKKIILKTESREITVYDNPLKIRIPMAPATKVHGRAKREIKRAKITLSNWEKF